MVIHESAEDYLESILIIQEQSGQVRSIDVVNKLGYSKPSVSIAMKKLRENGYKKISLTAKNAIPENFFSVPGTANLEWSKSKTSVSFMFSGTVMMIMNQLHRLELEDILIEEPSLEEIFLHYYE